MLKNLYLFNFHRVSDEVSPAYPPMPLGTFEKIIRLINRRFVVVPQEELLLGTMPNCRKDLCVITFDDAYYDFAEYALPILVKYKTPMSLHVVTDVATTGKMFWTQRLNKVVEAYWKKRKTIANPLLPRQYVMKNGKEVEKAALEIYLHLLGNPERDKVIDILANEVGDSVETTPMLMWDDIVKLPSDIVAIGSHTHTHRNLMQLPESEVVYELEESYRIIKEKTGTAPISIAYPNGQYNDKINEMALATGYKVLYTCDAKPVTESNSCIYHRYNLYNREFWKNRLKIDLFRLKSTI